MKTRILLVAGVFIICLALVVLFREAFGGRYKVHAVDFYESVEDWKTFDFDNMKADDDGRDLVLVDGSKPGKIKSAVFKTKYDFDEILLSWNCKTEDEGGIYISLSVSPDSSDWYEFDYQTWGGMNPDTLGLPELPHKIENIGYLDEDIIRLRQPMRFYRYTVHAFPGASGLFSLDRISVCYSKTDANIQEFNKFSPEPGKIEPVALAVPYQSQKWLPDSISGKTCSPTSVDMVLNYYGLPYSPIEVAATVYDKYNDIYGNWPYNAQAAYILGMGKTWIGRHNSFNELAAELKSGKPVVISIAVDETQKLTGAPYKTSEGHLIVVRGFDKDGNVLVNDPAASDIDGGIVTYDINELTDVWVGHDGVAYHIWPD